jgi:hypothetical protein
MLLKKKNTFIAVTHTLKVELVVGHEVFRQLENEPFLTAWDSLYQCCPWATPYQSKEYVGAWYQLYGEQYLPIMAKTQQGGTLTGLLTLAVPKFRVKGKKQFIVAAGNYDADYQTWLTREADGGAFIKAVFLELWKQFPGYDVMLKYLPSQTPLGWIHAEPFWQQRCALQPFRLPLRHLQGEEISGRSKKRVARLKSLAVFERVTDLEVFNSLLQHQIAFLFDFRQGAMFNKNPFRNDRANQKLLLSLFSAGLLHVTVLKVKEEVIACIAATIRKKRAYLGGINCHSPLYSDYSPGYQHFLLLSQQLAQEGFEAFDLTPGFDYYKERLATRHEQVHQLVVTNNRFYYVKRQARRWVHNRIVQAGMRPISVELELRRFGDLFRHHGLITYLGGWLESRWQKFRRKIYLAAVPSLHPGASPSMPRDSLGDLLCYEQEKGKPTRWEFLAASLHCFEQGGHCYTWAEGGRLLLCVWVHGSKSAPAGKGVRSEEGVWLSDLYCHAEGQDRLEAFLKATAAAAAASSSLERVYGWATNAFMCRSFEAVGFRQLKGQTVACSKGSS